jgi:hypothetical protein
MGIYILWDRFSFIMIIANTYFPGTFMYSSLLLWPQTLHTLQERLCTVLSYYNYSQYILPSNVYVQISLIWLRTIHTPQGLLYSSSLLLWLYLIHPSQERLCTVLSYYDYIQYILSRNVYVCSVLSYYDYDYSQYILPRNVYVHFCGERRLVIKFNIV